MFTLYPYQKEAIDTIITSIKSGDDKVASMLPTGTGKTIIEASLIEQIGLFPAAVVVPWRHLVDNAYAVLCSVFGKDNVGIVMADKNEHDKKIVVISIQSAMEEKRLSVLQNKFKLVIVDEMHYFMADRWGETLDRLGGTRVGFSATIGREDRKALAKRFGKLVYYKSIHEMIDQGYLCDLVGIRVNADVDFSTLPLTGNDYNDNDLDSLLNTEKSIELLYAAWKRHAHDRVTISFTPTVAMAENCAEYWKAKGESASWVCGSGPVLKDKEITERINHYVSGNTQCMFNAMKLGVGFDFRPIGCVYIMRPTKSQTYFIQQVGRGTRICSPVLYSEMTSGIADRVIGKKEDCIVLTTGGNNDMGIVQFPELFDLDEQTTQKIATRMHEQREERISYKALISATKFKSERVDLFNYSTFAWVKTNYGWVLQLSDEGQINIVRHENAYTVDAIVDKQKIEVQQHPLSLDWAMSIGDEYARQLIKGKKNVWRKKSPWRKHNITEAQFVLIKRFTKMFPKEQSYQEYIVSSDMIITKGEAAEIITRIFAEKKLS